MTLLYAVGGRQKSGVSQATKGWDHYAAGLIVSIDTATGTVEKLVDYRSPPDVCPPDDPSVVFKAATVTEDAMYVPTTTEVLIYEIPSFRKVGYVTHPYFNDVHHVLPTPEGDLLVANTGLDMVMRLTSEGALSEEWTVVDEDTWVRFSRETDYRKVASTKPHRSHPNFVFQLDGELWTTRCNQGDVFCLTRTEEPIVIADRPIHDGVWYRDSIYFTAVNGVVVVVDGPSATVADRVDLNDVVGEGPPLGWCRGIEVLDDRHVVVGFSRLRPTRWQENLRWVKHRLGGDGGGLLPTRIAMFDLVDRRLCWEIDLEPYDMNVVFSVHEARENQAADPLT